MNRYDYSALCQYARIALATKPVTSSRIANSFLSIVRPHPSLLAQYEPIFNSKFNLFNHLARNIYALAFIFKPLFNKKIKQHDVRRDKVDIVFFTHNSRPIRNLSYDEVYGKLPICVSNSQLRVAVLHLNHTSNKLLSAASGENQNETILHYEVSNIMGIFPEVWITFLQLIESLRLVVDSLFTQDDQQKSFLLFAAYNNSRGSSRRSLRIYFQAKNIIRKLSPRFFIVPFEGHSFERLLFKACNEATDKVISIAFQHAPLFKRQFELLDAFSDTFSPRWIMIPGGKSRTKFTANKTTFCKKVIQIGSPKISRFVVRDDRRKTKVEHRYTCLVLCEGFLDETLLLYSLVRKLATRFRSLRFIVRFHPSFSTDSTQRLKSNFASVPKNVKISDGSLAADAAGAKWCIYRGSGSIIEALHFGIIPIYYETTREFTIDPLWPAVRNKSLAARYGFFSLSRIKDFDQVFFAPKNNMKNDLKKRMAISRSIWSPLCINSFLDCLKP